MPRSLPPRLEEAEDGSVWGPQARSKLDARLLRFDGRLLPKLKSAGLCRCTRRAVFKGLVLGLGDSQKNPKKNALLSVSLHTPGEDVTGPPWGHLLSTR